MNDLHASEREREQTQEKRQADGKEGLYLCSQGSLCCPFLLNSEPDLIILPLAIVRNARIGQSKVPGVERCFGGVPNVTEFLGRIGSLRNVELLRAVKMLLNAKRTKGFRLGYLGVKPKYRRLGLDAVMIQIQREYALKRGYEYCDMGWVLEDNTMVVRMAERVHAVPSKTYTLYEKKI